LRELLDLEFAADAQLISRGSGGRSTTRACSAHVLHELHGARLQRRPRTADAQFVGPGGGQQKSEMGKNRPRRRPRLFAIKRNILRENFGAVS
jgi:hypothetical protein